MEKLWRERTEERAEDEDKNEEMGSVKKRKLNAE